MISLKRITLCKNTIAIYQTETQFRVVQQLKNNVAHTRINAAALTINNKQFISEAYKIRPKRNVLD